MSKYQAKQFSPRVYPEWGELLEDLSVEKQAEILNAIIKYPNENPAGGVWKFIKSQIDKDYAEFVERANRNKETIQNYWESRKTNVYDEEKENNDGKRTLSNDEQPITNDNDGKPITRTETRTRTETGINITKFSDKSSNLVVKRPAFDLTAINSVLKKFNLPEVQKMTDERKTKLTARVKDCGGLNEFLGQMEAALANSSFLRGDNNHAWKADFDFFLQKSSWQKVVEGNYNDRMQQTTPNAPDFSWV